MSLASYRAAPPRVIYLCHSSLFAEDAKGAMWRDSENGSPRETQVGRKCIRGRDFLLGNRKSEC